MQNNKCVFKKIRMLGKMEDAVRNTEKSVI